MRMKSITPARQGLYDPRFERDACGIGFVVDIKGRKSHEIIRHSLRILANLEHRGGSGAEPNTGDGAGILMQIPHGFLVRACADIGLALPEPGRYAVGMVFLPPDKAARESCRNALARIAAEEGQEVLGWRSVPTNDATLGVSAKAGKPFISQVFIGRGEGVEDERVFERKLYLIRRRAEKALRGEDRPGAGWFYLASLSSRTIVYKGMMVATQVEEFFPDLADLEVESALALVHSRYSTNTFPSWERAHPYRYMIHNGEINTLRGNINWMHARQSAFTQTCFGDELADVLPVLDQEGSDSAIFDNCLEFLLLNGRSLAHAVMMMIPEPWEKNKTMSREKRAFYEFHSCLMEPWDGPAAIAFTDGVQVGAVLDRNGLRPSRYCVTADGLVILASESGVVDVPPEKIVQRGRLQPGRMLLVDTAEGRIVADEEIKQRIAAEYPYREWLDRNQVRLLDLPAAVRTPDIAGEELLRRQKIFGYTYEDLRLILAPMARDAVEPVGAMGNDSPLAVLSERPQLLYNYFKQLFAQVTNPPIDALREEIVTSTEVLLGSEGNLLSPSPESCRQIKLATPIVNDEDLSRLLLISRPGFQAAAIPIDFPATHGGPGLEKAMAGLCLAADEAIAGGANILVLTDRGAGGERAAIPALLAVSGLHHHLIRARTRTRVALVLETGEAREVHHFAALLGYGASAINPYLALASIRDLVGRGHLPGLDCRQAEMNYLKAATKGVLKVLSKMGISTIQGYQGAQIFEAVGLGQRVIDQYFTWTPSRIGGIDLDIIAHEAALRLADAEESSRVGRPLLSGGDYQWRREGENHLYNPDTIDQLQTACRNDDYALYKKYSASINEQSQSSTTLRGLLRFKSGRTSVPMVEVESEESICRRFKTGAMSYGSLSQEAHEALAIAMNRLGGKSNSGEGGEDPARFAPLPNGDSKCSAIKQVASGRFGVTGEYLLSAREIQIKMAQGAKPGEGGQLPGRKVYPWIAKVRHATPGVGLISPPPHHDIYSIEDLAELIHDLKNANAGARIGVKLVSEVGVGTIAAGVAKGRADVILISGYDGGTGAAPRTSIKHTGLPWELGLAETHQTLLLNNLRDRVTLEVDGKLMTGRDVVIGAMLGAEEFGFATLPLVALGCVMMRICNLDTCPVGIATQNPDLRKRFAGDPAHVVNLMRFIAREVREIMAELGCRTFEELIGRTDLLEQAETGRWKSATVDLSSLLYRPDVPAAVGRCHRIAQDHGLDASFDRRVLLKICRPALAERRTVRAILPISNTNRVVGTLLGSEITRRFGASGLAEDTIRLHFKGTAGQSFGAFIPRGLTLTLEGDANDYFGKGLSGGKVIAFPPDNAGFVPEENVIIGNVSLYGATSGEAYIRGAAGERFAVRNSGASAVVEAVGDHGCEYMTGGRVVVLGSTGRNFAAGMSGGVAYVFDEAGEFAKSCNMDMVGLERIEEEEEADLVKALIMRHLEYTGSERARKILAAWEQTAPRFVKVMPLDYRRVLETFRRVERSGLSGEEATMAAFEQNKQELSRVSGN